MSKEKFVLSFIAILLGLFVAGGAFYIYQMTRTVNDTDSPKPSDSIKPTTIMSNSSNFLIIQNPKDEEVFDKRLITVTGKTTPDALVIVSTQGSDEIVKPNTKGDFTLTHTLEDGVNMLNVTAIFANGEEQRQSLTVTSSTEDF